MSNDSVLRREPDSHRTAVHETHYRVYGSPGPGQEEGEQMKELFTIGEMARLFDVNIRTLRYYDDIGILRPETTDPDSGYRYYSSRQFERMNTIKYLRALDMPLKKIALFFEKRDVKSLQMMMEEQKQDTRRKIESLMRIEQKLERRLSSLEDAVSAPTGEIREIYSKKRQIAFLRKEIALGDDLEYPIRELERASLPEPAVFLGKVGVAISKENLMKRRFEHFSGIFVVLEDGDSYSGAEQYLSEGIYLTVRFTGTHKGAAGYYERLLAYMEEKGYTLAGDSVEVTLIDAGFTDDTEQYVTELQIPVEKRGRDVMTDPDGRGKHSMPG